MHSFTEPAHSLFSYVYGTLSIEQYPVALHSDIVKGGTCTALPAVNHLFYCAHHTARVRHHITSSLVGMLVLARTCSELSRVVPLSALLRTVMPSCCDTRQLLRTVALN